MSTGSTTAGLRQELLIGKREVNSYFADRPLRPIKAGDVLTPGDDATELLHVPVYRLRSGWACQFRHLKNGRRSILDVYLPGNVIGLDAALHTRPIENVLALTSVAFDSTNARGGLYGLLAHRQTALYVAWLLGQRQRRADRLLMAISALDARGRVAMMIYDFYKRLRVQRPAYSQSYNLPLTQSHIGSYLGLTVVHVNRVLRILRDEQIATIEKHCVTILNLDKLVKVAQHNELDRQAAAAGDMPPYQTEATFAAN